MKEKNVAQSACSRSCNLPDKEKRNDHLERLAGTLLGHPHPQVSIYVR
jgi:hypothetical protein